MKNHIFIFWNQRLRVDNPELLNLHKRLTIQPLVIKIYRPMSPICQRYYFTVGEKFYKNMGILLGGLSDCEELVEE